MRDALLLKLEREAKNSRSMIQNLRLIANGLLDMAEAGDIRAIEEIQNRLDGKPRQAKGLSDGPQHTTIEWLSRHS